MNCTIALSTDSESELLKAVVQHAIAVHGDMIRSAMKDGTLHIEAPRRAA